MGQDFNKDYPKADTSNTLPPINTLKDSVIRRGADNQAYYVLSHKTDNIHDLFILGRKLGQGRFGTTYSCTEISTGIEYACKSISKRRLISKEDVRREIQIMHHLAGHKNIVTIKGVFEDSLYVHIVKEICAGGELFDSIIQRGHYSEKKAAELMKIIVGVVEACHSLGVIHRDLKPDNFLFVNKDDDFSLKAIDFGLSVYFKPGRKFTDVVGSPCYVAPEMLLERYHYGLEVDVWTAGVILYILLSGVPPFWAETEEGIFDAVCIHAVVKAEIDFDSDPWPLISDSAKDLIRKMLCPLSERLTAKEVLCHPWICENGVAPDRSLDPAVLSRLKQFSVMNKLKKMALQVIVESLSEEEIAGLKEMFTAMDTDSSGAITFDKFKAGLKKYGATLEDTEIPELMDAADVDNSGTIDYEEFITAAVHLNKLEREEHLVAAFQYFDKDSSGYIKIDEPQQACTEHNMTDVLLEDIIREVDQDNWSTAGIPRRLVAFNVEAYAARYQRPTKITRLLFIADNSDNPAIQREALILAYRECRVAEYTFNIDIYREVVVKMEGKLGEEYGKEYGLNFAWLDHMEAERKLDQEVCDREESLESRDKESYFKSASFYHCCGALKDALKHILLAQEYCITLKDKMVSYLLAISVSIEMGQFTHVPSYVESATEILEQGLVEGVPCLNAKAKLSAALGLSLLKSKKYKLAAQEFLKIGSELGNSYNYVIAPQDIAIYGGLCALASFNRSELKEKVIDNLTFRDFLELVPEVKKLIIDFYSSYYASCLDYLGNLKSKFLLDIHLHDHVQKLYKDIREKALVQYTRCSLSVDLRKMANAFNTDLVRLEKELEALITDNQIQARIDSHAKILRMRCIDQRSATGSDLSARLFRIL